MHHHRGLSFRVLVVLSVYAAIVASMGAWLIISAVHAERSRLGQRGRPSIADEIEVWLRQH